MSQTYITHRHANSFFTRNNRVTQGNYNPLNARAELVPMNIYQLILIHQDRKQLIERGNDNINFFTILAEKIEDVNIQNYGEVAVATYRIIVKGADKTGNYSGSYRGTTVWKKNTPDWQMIAWHLSKEKPEGQKAS